MINRQMTSGGTTISGELMIVVVRRHHGAKIINAQNGTTTGKVIVNSRSRLIGSRPPVWRSAERSA